MSAGFAWGAGGAGGPGGCAGAAAAPATAAAGTPAAVTACGGEPGVAPGACGWAAGRVWIGAARGTGRAGLAACCARCAAVAVTRCSISAARSGARPAHSRSRLISRACEKTSSESTAMPTSAAKAAIAPTCVKEFESESASGSDVMNPGSVRGGQAHRAARPGAARLPRARPRDRAQVPARPAGAPRAAPACAPPRARRPSRPGRPRLPRGRAGSISANIDSTACGAIGSRSARRIFSASVGTACS